MAVYNGNDYDDSTKDELSGKLLNKVVGQVLEAKTFGDKFGVFTKHMIDEAGNQIEDIECANLTKQAFDPDGKAWLTRHKANLKSLFFKKGARSKFETTVSATQVEQSMLSMGKTTELGNKLVAELYNSSYIDDFDNMYTLFTDICMTQKNMPVCDLNGNSDPDSLIKAVQIISDNMTMPRTEYNFLGFKREFIESKDELVLIIDSATKARMNVDALAGAFNMDKKNLVSNMIVLDKMPAISYTGEKAKATVEIEIGSKSGGVEPPTPATIKLSKLTQLGNDTTVTGKVKMLLVSKKAIIRDPVVRKVVSSYNGDGDFYNYILHKQDMLSYNPLRNAIVFVD